MTATYEMSMEATASVTKILGKNRIDASEAVNVQRANAGRIIINTDPESPSMMKDRITNSILGLYANRGYCGLDIADVIVCWAIAFPHKVGSILECVASGPLPYKSDPHAEGYVLGFYEAANRVGIDDLDNVFHTDNVINKLLTSAFKELWWDKPEIQLNSYVSGRLSGGLAQYYGPCWDSSRESLCRRYDLTVAVLRSVKFVVPEAEKGQIQSPHKNLHWALAYEIGKKFVLSASPSRWHQTICRGLRYAANLNAES